MCNHCIQFRWVPQVQGVEARTAASVKEILWSPLHTTELVTLIKIIFKMLHLRCRKTGLDSTSKWSEWLKVSSMPKLRSQGMLSLI